jgi:polar amino acid transport system substrate-binding protein
MTLKLSPLTRRHLWLLVPVFVGFVLAGHNVGRAQDKSLTGKTLVWAADESGGVPYVIKLKDDPPKDEPEGPVTGFEAELRDALEKELGCRIVFKHYDFDNLFTGLERDDFDIAMNGLEITSKNKERALFTNPYYLYQQQLVVRADEKDFATLEECRKKNLNVGTLGGSAAVRALEDAGFKPYQIKDSYRDQDGPYSDLSVNRNIRAVLLDLPVAIYYAKPYKQLEYGRGAMYPGLKFLGQPFAEGYYGIAVKKGRQELVDQLNAALERIKKSGQLRQILAKWYLWDVDQYKLDGEIQVAEKQTEPWTFDRYFPLLLAGAGKTVYITFAGFALAMLIGLPLALMRLYGAWPLRWLAVGYIEFFRGIPVLLLLYFLYFGLAQFGEPFDLFGVTFELEFLKLNALTAAILGFGLNYAAYEAEIYRAGIGSVAHGQWEAAASLGMSTPLTFRRIILPQAIRVVLPPMTNDFVALFKDTSIVSIIAVTELSMEYQILTKSGGGYLTIGLCTAMLYLIMSVPLGYLSRHLEKRWSVR